MSVIESFSNSVRKIVQGPLYKWTEHSQTFIFWNYKVGVPPIPPQGWMEVVFWDHTLLYQKAHIKTFLMRGQKIFWVH